MPTDTQELTTLLRSLPRTLAPEQSTRNERQRDAARGTYTPTGQHAEHGASQH